MVAEGWLLREIEVVNSEVGHVRAERDRAQDNQGGRRRETSGEEKEPRLFDPWESSEEEPESGDEEFLEDPAEHEIGLIMDRVTPRRVTETLVPASLPHPRGIVLLVV